MKQHILVVDDEIQIRELLAIYLGKKGYSVSTAASSNEVLKSIGDNPVDLVVLDISLDGEDGLKLLAKLKLKRPGLPVVMLTGMGFVEDLLLEAQQQGADGYVSKIMPLDELLITIQRVLKPSPIPMECCGT